MKALLQRHIWEIVFLFGLCSLAFFLRSYALYRDLFFAFDQGRDAWEIVKMQQGDLTLIGPVTGLAGVFLGPFWYYLLFPLYWIGNGNPVVPALGMIALHTFCVAIIYSISKRIANWKAGVISSVLFTISFSNIMFSRWLSNPAPLPFFSLLSFICVWKALTTKKSQFFILAGILFGLCMQLEAANAVWYIPTVALLYAYEVLFVEKNLSSIKEKLLVFFRWGIFTALGFGITLAPQMLFEMKWNFLISKNLLTAFETTHSITLAESLPTRLRLLFELYSRGMIGDRIILGLPILALLLILLFALRRQFYQNRGLRIIISWFMVPLFFHAIYTGNFGNFWDYYVVAQHVPLYIMIGSLIGLGITLFPRAKLLLTSLMVFFLISSVVLNYERWKGFLTPYADRFSLQMQVEATKWIASKAGSTRYGTWVYTPDAQDQAHRYVFYWIGRQLQSMPGQHVEQEPLIFMVVEDDAGHAKRRSEWIATNQTFGNLIETKKFGAITVFMMENTFITQQ